MSHEEIYGGYGAYLAPIMQDLIRKLEDYNKENKAATGFKLYEHLIYRVKAEDSMRDKCRRKGLEQTPQSALKVIRDAIGVHFRGRDRLSGLSGADAGSLLYRGSAQNHRHGFLG